MKLIPAHALARALEEEIPEARIARVLSDAMAADLVNRDGSRGPDHKTRLAAAETALAYRVGLPIRREESVVVNVDPAGSDDIKERLARSPALRRAFRDLLAGM
ncbi:MAG: hypothetical protein KDN05_03525 [Verrucomicrobiae bacterium]|nr:hypothetical protein [Verrucomicrobiae bacterium]MCP5532268.1 hypothetical protein [Akkermansiaceae bacterium]MCP5542961.1 hypothetical protein [Akkermansiaceae bacterium]MCP5547747.1 hypothetical protein [Akkermansiaceae bacterium]